MPTNSRRGCFILCRRSRACFIVVLAITVGGLAFTVVQAATPCRPICAPWCHPTCQYEPQCFGPLCNGHCCSGTCCGAETGCCEPRTECCTNQCCGLDACYHCQNDECVYTCDFCEKCDGHGNCVPDDAKDCVSCGDIFTPLEVCDDGSCVTEGCYVSLPGLLEICPGACEPHEVSAACDPECGSVVSVVTAASAPTGWSASGGATCGDDGTVTICAPMDVIPNLPYTIPLDFRMTGIFGAVDECGSGSVSAHVPCATEVPSASDQFCVAWCGQPYGARFKYCYFCNGAPAAGWWWVESVYKTEDNCQVAPIYQTSVPVQMSDGCIFDEIAETNGPPWLWAPCRSIRSQQVRVGPSGDSAVAGDCEIAHTQTIIVDGDAASGRVTTSVAGVTQQCDYP